MYGCVVCGEALFDSDTKYESGSGWPSFYDITDVAKIRKRADASGGESQYNLTLQYIVIGSIYSS